jgi:hypothetical protein
LEEEQERWPTQILHSNPNNRSEEENKELSWWCHGRCHGYG